VEFGRARFPSAGLAALEQSPRRKNDALPHSLKEEEFVKEKFIGIVVFMKRTYQPKKRKRARAHGFLARTRSQGGRRLLIRRRRKGRARLSV